MGMLTQHKKSKQIFIFVIAYLFFSPIYADEPPTQLYEQKIKAGLVYNLLKYTSWPVLANAPTKEKNILKVCLFGEDVFNGYLSPLQGRTAQQAVIAIEQVKQVSETATCNVVIIHHNQEDQLVKLLQFLNNKHVLTISDINQFTHKGGMVELAKEGEKISFYINKSAIDHANLDIEGHMLKLAKIVTE